MPTGTQVEGAARVELSFVALAALTAGLTGSAHCGVMCGPLAAMAKRPLGWHMGRLTAYGFVGFLLGALGRGVTQALRETVQPALPWVMAAGLVLTALDLTKHVPGLAVVSRGLARAGAKVDPFTRALLLGASTAFLPCGLLYGMFVTALATASAAGGAAVMVAFGLGGVPALVAAQWGTRWLARFPRTSRVVRVAVPLVAAALIVVRALATKSDPAVCH